MDIFKSLDELFSNGDPTARTWFLVKQSYLPFLICTLYVIFCTTVGPALMRDRKPFELRIPMIVFNFAVVFAYVYQLSIVAVNLPKVTWHSFCIGSVAVKGTPEYTLGSTAYAVYILKYVELLDTVFFVLRKKSNQITKLHVIHHTIIPLVGWIMMRTEKSGFQGIPVLINAVVHVIMYSYYGLSAMGPRVQKYLWWKKYVTQLQMAQFIVVILFVLLVVPYSGCSMAIYSYIMDVTIAGFFFHMFYQYYKSSFKPTAKSEKIVRITSTNGHAKQINSCKTPEKQVNGIKPLAEQNGSFKLSVRKESMEKSTICNGYSYVCT